MLENNNLIIIIILTLLIVSIITWIILTLRNIRFRKRINNYVINKNISEDISIFGKLERKYLNLRKKLVKILKNNYKNKKLTNEEKEARLIFTCDKILASFITLIMYLVICLITLSKPKVLLIATSLLLGYLFPIIKRKIEYQINRKQIEKDLLKAVSLMNNSLQAGKSMIQAIKTVSNELDGPIAVEFKKIEKDIEKGLSLKVAFTRFEKRVNLEEVDYITVSLLILNQTGGDMVTLFKSLEDRLYTRKKLDSELKAIIASSKLLFQILVSLPLFIYLVIGFFNPTYFTIFFKSQIGILLFSIIGLIYLIYIIVIKNIMKVENY